MAIGLSIQYKRDVTAMKIMIADYILNSSIISQFVSCSFIMISFNMRTEKEIGLTPSSFNLEEYDKNII